MSPSRSVLFVCLHGAAKSVLAAADFERLAAERGLAITADSAGTEPDPEIAPGVAAARKSLGEAARYRASARRCQPRRPGPAGAVCVLTRAGRGTHGRRPKASP